MVHRGGSVCWGRPSPSPWLWAVAGTRGVDGALPAAQLPPGQLGAAAARHEGPAQDPARPLRHGEMCRGPRREGAASPSTQLLRQLAQAQLG
jgi:hypothetical protein